MRFATAVLVVLAASVSLWTAEKARAQTQPQPVAIQGDGITLSGYLFVPADLHRKAPGVILLHGWGRSAELLAEDATSLAANGYVALTLSMRGWGQTGGNDDCGLQQPDDTVLALRWLAQRPEVNGARLGIIGFSKGGQVALLTAARTRSLRAIVAYFPITDIDSFGTTSTQFGVQSYVSGTCSIGDAAARSPVVSAARISGSVLLIHGDADTTVPARQSILMQEALRRAGKRVELRLVPGAGHEFTADVHAQSWQWTLAFLARNL
jgi:dipeptidyl aminopeptidase/acylaminoacyl peptidase